jgi:hypothetical protein
VETPHDFETSRLTHFLNNWLKVGGYVPAALYPQEDMLTSLIDTTTVQHINSSFLPEMKMKSVSLLSYMISCLKTLAANSLSCVKLVSLLSDTEDNARIMMADM